MRILVIIPAYNEAENIKSVIESIRECKIDLDYIVINDCSKDETEQILRQEGANYISLPINLGIGGGVQAGYMYARKYDYDVVIQFDGDGQHDAEYLSALVEPIENGEADVVIGSRFLEKQGFQSSTSRRLGINFLSFLVKILCGIRIKDVTSGFRAVNRTYINLFAEEYAQDYPEPEAIIQCVMNGARIKEVPVMMKERESGISSITALKSVYYMLKVSIAMILQKIMMRKGGKR